jgi:hypothetical protein
MFYSDVLEPHQDHGLPMQPDNCKVEGQSRTWTWWRIRCASSSMRSNVVMRVRWWGCTVRVTKAACVLDLRQRRHTPDVLKCFNMTESRSIVNGHKAWSDPPAQPCVGSHPQQTSDSWGDLSKMCSPAAWGGALVSSAYAEVVGSLMYLAVPARHDAHSHRICQLLREPLACSGR